MGGFVIASTRFNTPTWEENVAWRRRRGWEGCIYGTPKRMGETIAAEAGVSFLRCTMIKIASKVSASFETRCIRRRCRIYKSDPNYNRYIYRGGIRVDRDDLCDETKNNGDSRRGPFQGFGALEGTRHIAAPRTNRQHQV